MPVPLAVAVPAAAAGAAYLNARHSLFYDLHMLASVLPPAARLAWSAFRDRLSLFYWFEAHATAPSTADHAFVLFEDRRHTYAQAYDRVLRYGHWLRARLGVERGQIVALDFQNTDHFVFLILALWAVGAKPALVNYNLAGAPLVHCVRKATTRLLLVDPAVAPLATADEVRAQLADVRVEVFTPEREAQALALDPVRCPDALRGGQRPEDMALLIYTSGTTGLPKAAIVSWGKLVVAPGYAANFISLTRSDVYYISMPIYHGTATILGVAPVLYAGATLALGRRFSTSQFWPDVRRFGATVIQYVGETCRYLLAAPADVDPATGASLDRRHRVRLAFGNGLRPDVWDRFRDRFGIDTITEFYAATESSMATFNLSRNDFARGAVGRSGLLYRLLMARNLALVEIDLDTENPRRDRATGLCRQPPRGAPGELLFRLPARDVQKRFQGYFNDGEATSRKILRDVFRRGDAWFRTGDLVRWDAEGRLYFADRLGDTFRWKSENVATAEVAQVLGAHAAVREAAVYGVRVPHHEGRAGCAAVVLADGRADAATLRSLAEHVRAGLPRYALPLFLRVVRGGSLQTTGTNKHLKHQLREEGVDPRRVGGGGGSGEGSGQGAGDALYWLRGDTYVPFGPAEWAALEEARVKL